MDRSKALAALSALAHETRLDLVRLLVPLGAAGMPAGQIAQALSLAAPRLSFHLAALEQVPGVGPWTLAMVAGWKALEKDCTGWWAVTGVGLMGTFLSKYFSPFLIAGFAAFFWIHPPARRHLPPPPLQPPQPLYPLHPPLPFAGKWGSRFRPACTERPRRL